MSSSPTVMSPPRTIVLIIFAMLAFAGNSLLCRMALKHTSINAASFTSFRLISGALMLWLIVRLRGETNAKAGSWLAAMALFAYAACFAIAYVSLPAGTGALLLFGSVQITMIGYGLWTGERLRRLQSIGLILAVAGLIGLLLPGLTTPLLQGSLLMLVAGVAWGIYSLLGKGVANPTQITASNFLRAVPFAIGLSVITYPQMTLDLPGVGYAIASGAITSGIGYAIWYRALPHLQATQAATVQLSVPILAAVGAIIFLNESMTLRLGLATVAVLSGIALVIKQQPQRI
ncbi:MAG: DMT family transporter [Pelatocladus maniniholoensis HA4357-MV3]|jgi:drug/metabolite transporter (DMT)-like permease|uniref:DMT family transporter n=1 Tax=Pelatocladus maniniholoensis HA4357-MV3 TaxID=1117104 RepID=A0A9E3LU98_9NOST|nr:DMT family transporter [Pelatocladus maniniholoensis HA4357-MV3]